jgi:hypothetical protein
VTTVALAPVGFLSMFSVFQPWDDEGFFLLNLRNYLGGHAAYSQIYGPFFYEVMGGVFRILGLGVSTDNGRIVTLVVWLLASLIGGITVLTLTRNVWLAVSGEFLTFHALSALANEPMHPSGLIGGLLVGLALLAAYRSRTPRASATLMGAVVAAMILVKINVGAFAALAVAFALAASLSGRWKRVVLPAVGLVMVAAPLLLMARLFDLEWVWELALVISLSAAGIGIAGFVVRAPTMPRSDAVWLIAGGAAMTIVCLGIAAVGGLRASDLVESVVSALKTPQLFVLPARISALHVGWALLCLAAAVAILLGRFGARTSPAIPAFLRIAIGAITWLAVLLLPSWYFLLALPLAWVGVLPPSGDDENPADPWARLLLTALAVTGTLQAYPVAGTQEWLAASTLVPVGAVVFNDGLRELRASALARRSQSLLKVAESQPRGAVIVNVAVWALFVYLTGMAYASGQALGLPGTELMRLPPAQASSLQSLVRAIDEDCATLITVPRMPSLNLWTRREDFTQLNEGGAGGGGVWMFSLSASDQQSVVSQIRERQSVCVALSPSLVNFWAEGRPVPRRPLVEYIDTAFEPAGTFGIYELLVRRPQSAAAAARLDGPTRSFRRTACQLGVYTAPHTDAVPLDFSA